MLDPLTASSRANDEARSACSSTSAPINAAKMVDSALHVKRSERSALKSDRIALPILVNIPRADIEQGTIQHRALYVVEVAGFGERTVVKYSFEKFEELYNAVSRKTQYALPALPQSHWFGTTKPELVEERRIKLLELLQKMLMLQEVLNDHEELLWKFLQLPRPVVVAARFLACGPTAKRLWLDRLWETSADKGGHKALQHPLVEKELVTLAREACGCDEDQEKRPVSEEALSSASIACDLLARIFQRSNEAERDASLGALPPRHQWIEVLLLCCRIEEPRLENPTDSFGEDQQFSARRLPLRETASKALRTLARSDREAWAKILAAFLEEGGLAHLTSTADATAADGGEGCSRQPFQRLVAELLLRGFEKRVVVLFASNDRAKERRALLNTLFMSSDNFVRIMVGLFLCALLCEDGFADEQKAQLGVEALLADLQQKSAELSQADICLQLLEPDIWTWLCSLVAAPRALVNTYALLVVIFVVKPAPVFRPETVFETEGLHQTLLSLCEPEADPTSRFFASKLLLIAHREGKDIASPLQYPELGYLSSCLAINFQAQYEYDLGQQDVLESEVARACQWSEAAANLHELQQQACSHAADLQSEASEWTHSVAMAGKSTDLTHQSSNQVAEALAAFSLSLDRASNAISDGTPSMEEMQLREELAAEEALLSERECALSELKQSSNALAEERCALSESMAEKDEVAHRLESSIAEATENAEASLGTPPGLPELLSNYRKRHSDALEQFSVMKEQAEELDARLAEKCEPIPRWQAEIEQSRCRVDDLRARSSALSHSSSVIETWGGLMDRQKECSNGHETVRRSLRDVRTCVMSERERRRALRNSVQQLLQSLTHLDSHLETLEEWDALDAEGGFLSFDVNS